MVRLEGYRVKNSKIVNVKAGMNYMIPITKKYALLDALGDFGTGLTQAKSIVNL